MEVLADTWRVMDEYYWAGPMGWTICRVWVDDSFQYELWWSRGEDSRRIGTRRSLSAAQQMHIDVFEASHPTAASEAAHMPARLQDLSP